MSKGIVVETFLGGGFLDEKHGAWRYHNCVGKVFVGGGGGDVSDDNVVEVIWIIVIAEKLCCSDDFRYV